MKDLDNITIGDLLPDSIGKDETVKATAESVDPQLRIVSRNIDLPSIYVSIDRLASGQLDHLATQYDVTVWRDSWPLTLKRAVLKTAIAEKRRKGTVGAVREALESISSAASIVEWWQQTPKGTPHTFTIYATQSQIEGTIDAELQEDLIALIDDAKPLRSHYDFIIQNQAHGGINAYGCIRAATYKKIYDNGVLTQGVSGSVGIVTVARMIVKRQLIARA